MRHRVSGKKLNRDREHRTALLKNLSESLIMHDGIKTTLAKAKYLRPYVERLITKAKTQDYQAVRYLKSRLYSDLAVRKLITQIAPANKNRPGGYTRITKTGNRGGDNAQMARIELVEPKVSETKVKKTTEKGETTK